MGSGISGNPRSTLTNLRYCDSTTVCTVRLNTSGMSIKGRCGKGLSSGASTGVTPGGSHFSVGFAAAKADEKRRLSSWWQRLGGTRGCWGLLGVIGGYWGLLGVIGGLLRVPPALACWQRTDRVVARRESGASTRAQDTSRLRVGFVQVQAPMSTEMPMPKLSDQCWQCSTHLGNFLCQTGEPAVLKDSEHVLLRMHTMISVVS